MMKAVPFWAGVVAVVTHMGLRYSLRFFRKKFNDFSLIIFRLRFHWSFIVFIVLKVIYSEILFTFCLLSLCCCCCPCCCYCFIFCRFTFFFFGFRLLNYQNITNFSRICVRWYNRDSLICITRINYNLIVFISGNLSLKFIFVYKICFHILKV